LISEPSPVFFLGRPKEKRGSTYRLEKLCGEVLVNRKVTLLDSEAALDGGLLYSIIIISKYSNVPGAVLSRYTHRRSLEGRGNGTTTGESEHDGVLKEGRGEV
jgi:hypothetical protein